MNTKNKILKYSLIGGIIAAGLSFGCGKSFLDVPPQGQQTEDEVKQDPNAASNLVLGTYNTLYFGGFDNTTVGLLFSLTADVASDDADKGSTASDGPEAKQMDNFTIDPHNFYL